MLYENDFTVPTADQNLLVTSITFTTTATGNTQTNIFAVSGVTTPVPEQQYANNVSVTAGSAINVANALTATMGTLTINGSTLSVMSNDTSGNPYSMSFGATTLMGNATFSVANSSGGGAGTLLLGAVTDNSMNYGIAATGPGALVLTAAGSYSGATTVGGNGTLRAANGSSGSATGIGPVSIAAGSTLGVTLAGGSGTITPGPGNTVTLAGTLSGANGVTLTLGNGLLMQTGATIAAGLTGTPNGTSGSPLFAISGGTFDVSSGPYTINLSGTVGVGTYDLVNYTGASTNGSLSITNFPIGTMPSGGYTYTLVSNTSTDQLDLVVFGAITWTGQTNGNPDGNWTTSYTSTNWASGAYPTANAGQYLDGVPVTFTDTNPLTNSAITTADVIVQSAGVNPTSVTLSNNAVAYTIDSTGSSTGISGSTGITLGGTGSVTLLGPNTYTGTTTLNAGTLVISNNNSLGSTSGTIAPLVFNGGTLRSPRHHQHRYFRP